MESLGLFLLCFLPFLEHTCIQCILWVVELLVGPGFPLQGIRQIQERVLQNNHQMVESSLISMVLLLIEVRDQLAPVLVSGKILPTVKGLLEAPFGSVLAGEDL